MQSSSRRSSRGLPSVSPGFLVVLALALQSTTACSSSGASSAANPDARAGIGSGGGGGLAGRSGATGGNGNGSSGGAGGALLGAGGGGAPGPSNVQVTDRWPYRPSDRYDHLLGPAIAARADEGVVAYLTEVRSSDPRATGLTIQRIDGHGVRVGAPVVLATGDPSSVPALATDGQRTITCWSETDQTRCASLEPGQTELTPIYQGAGVLPALVHGPGGWLLGWRAGTTNSAQIVLQKMRLTDTATPSLEEEGAPIALSPTGTEGAPIIAATGSGFVLASGPSVTVQRLGADLQPQGAAVDLDVDVFYYEGAMAVTGSSIAVALAQPYKALLCLVDATGQVTRSSLWGGVKMGIRIGVSADPGGPAAFWPEWDDNGPKRWVFQHPLTPTPLDTQGGFSRQALADEEGHMALARVGDAFFVALSETPGEIEILSVGR